jgi:hypothetical protein
MLQTSTSPKANKREMPIAFESVQVQRCSANVLHLDVATNERRLGLHFL